MMLGTIVLSNYMNKFPSNSTEKKKKKKKTVHVIGDRVLPTALLPQHMATCELLFNQFLTNSGFHLNKIFPIFLIFLSLSFSFITSSNPISLSLWQRKKRKRKNFPLFSLSPITDPPIPTAI